MLIFCILDKFEIQSATDCKALPPPDPGWAAAGSTRLRDLKFRVRFRV